MNPNHQPFPDILRLRGLQFFGRHGTEPWEKHTGRRFIVDLELTADFSHAAQSDRLDEALDYRVVYSRAKHVVEAESHDLIERVAWRLLCEMFRTFAVTRVLVRVAKPEAPIGGLNHAVEVEICRTFEEWKESDRAEQASQQSER